MKISAPGATIYLSIMALGAIMNELGERAISRDWKHKQ